MELFKPININYFYFDIIKAFFCRKNAGFDIVCTDDPILIFELYKTLEIGLKSYVGLLLNLVNGNVNEMHEILNKQIILDIFRSEFLFPKI